ncbi:hypothetical protein HPB50_007080 [Hyalomma asiaticum]|uniref:Uncharacterized protein n=1 Tax=Hyalomma asiaticum TaxID=266040 RepID=A0ACB7SD30_HYAAI|nr:hypothetical protein HPB50_007080 [Hyalomma asiaticum]
MGVPKFLVCTRNASQATKLMVAEGFRLNHERVAVEAVGPPVTYVNVYRLPAYVPDDTLTHALQQYGKVRSVNFATVASRQNKLNGVRVVKIEISRPVPNFATIQGHRVMFEYRGMRLVCARCGEDGHMATACSSPYCKRCGPFGHETEGCEEDGKRCGGRHGTRECFRRRSYVAAARGFPPINDNAPNREQVREPIQMGSLKISILYCSSHYRTFWLEILIASWIPAETEGPTRGCTRTSKTTASRIDRIYLPEFLVPPLETEERTILPVAVTIRGSPGPTPHNSNWRLDPVLLEDEASVEKLQEQIRQSMQNLSVVNPDEWDRLKSTWKALLQEEGRARQRRYTAEMNEVLCRMQIIKRADLLTSCTSDYLETLRAKHDRLLLKKREWRLHDMLRAPSRPVCRGGGSSVVSPLGRS